MKTAAKHTFVLISASVFGLILALNSPKSASADVAVSTDNTTVNLTGTDSASALIAQVDWSKVKQEATPSTF